jgi:hypothetical protein
VGLKVSQINAIAIRQKVTQKSKLLKNIICGTVQSLTNQGKMLMDKKSHKTICYQTLLICGTVQSLTNQGNSYKTKSLAKQFAIQNLSLVGLFKVSHATRQKSHTKASKYFSFVGPKSHKKGSCQYISHLWDFQSVANLSNASC